MRDDNQPEMIPASHSNRKWQRRAIETIEIETREIQVLSGRIWYPVNSHGRYVTAILQQSQDKEPSTNKLNKNTPKHNVHHNVHLSPLPPFLIFQ